MRLYHCAQMVVVTRSLDLLQILLNHVIHNGKVVSQVQAAQAHVHILLLVKLNDALTVVLDVAVLVSLQNISARGQNDAIPSR